MDEHDGWKGESDERKHVLFLLTLHMCGNIGMNKVNGKVALWI